MAKQPTEQELFVGLQKVVDGRVMPLKAKGGQNPVDGIFPTGKTGDALIKMATEENKYLELCPALGAKGAAANKKTHGSLTQAGRAWILGQASPKAALELVRAALVQLAPPSGVNPSELAIVQAQLANLNAAVQEVVGAVRAVLTDRRQTDQSIVAAIGAAEQVIEQKLAGAKHPPSGSEVPAPAKLNEWPALTSEVLRLVREKAAGRGEEMRFDDLFIRLRQIDSSLTPGRFQDLLRELQAAGEVTFTNWGKSLDELPQTDLYFLVGRKGMYYVALAHR